MGRVKRSEYIEISKRILQILYRETCYGKGSLYIDAIKRGAPKNQLDKFEIVIEALVKQEICGKKKKEHGWKYFLNMERIDKIEEILQVDDNPFRILLILHNL